MAAIKHYGIADLYDPDRPTAEDSAVSRIDALALGRNVRAWMRVRAQSKTPNKTVTETTISDHLDTGDHSPTEPQPSPHLKPQKPSFASLPGEIRNTIYSLALFPRHTTLLSLSYSQPRDIFRTLLRNHIFRVSRQIRAEALSFLAATKTFQIPGIATATTFFRFIGPVGRVNLTNVSIAISCKEREDLGEGKELLRLMGEVKGPGIKRVMIVVQGESGLGDGTWAFLNEMKKALEEGCEEMVVTWGLFLDTKPDMTLDMKKTIERMEGIFGKGTRVTGIWSSVDSKCI